MTLPTILAAIVVAGALLYVARPFFRAPERQTMDADGTASRRLAFVEERDRALAALQELEFDHRTGKISDRDYRELIGPLRRHAVETLRSLEPRDPPLRSVHRSREERAKVGVGG